VRARRVVLGVTGSIAAYKAVELLRRLQDRGFDVSVVMTRSATEFVTELTFRTLSRNPVGVDMFEPAADWRPDHLALADRADVFVVAPCTANVLAKMAHGIADDLLSCTALSVTCPVVVAPAMNTKMWQHPATQANVKTLAGRGVIFAGVGTGHLACGAEGKGRMAETDDIVRIVEKALKTGGKGRRR